MPATCISPAVDRRPRHFSLLQWIGGAKRLPKLDLSGLPRGLLYDLGFEDRRIAPPRDVLRD